MTRGTLWALISILALAAGLRVYALPRESLWFDEVVVATVATLRLDEVISTTRLLEKTPPLHYFLVNLWGRAFGLGEASVRLPSVIAGVASVWLMFSLLTRRLKLPAVAGLAGAALLAVNPYHIERSQEARSYSLLVMLAMWATCVLVSAIERFTWPRAIGYVIVAAAMLYTHLYGTTVLVAHGVTLLIVLLREPRRWRQALVLIAGPIVLFSPFVPTVLLWSEQLQGAFWMKRVTPADFWHVYAVYAGSSAALAIMLVLICLALTKRPASATLLPILVLPVVPSLVISLIKHSTFHQRYGIAATIGLIGLAGAGIAALPKRSVRIIAVVIVIVASAIGISYQPVHTDWRGASQLLDRSMQTGDVALVNNSNTIISYRYYVKRDDVRAMGFDGPAIPGSPTPGQRVWLILDRPTASEDDIVRSGNWRIINRHEFRGEREHDSTLVVLELQLVD